MARRRTLRPEERELWQAVAQSARPMHSRPATVADPLPLPEVPSPADPAPPPPLPKFRLGEGARPRPPLHDIAPGPAQSLAAQGLRMDAKTHARMTRGKLHPEARLDLHGMTLSEAHEELIRFLMAARGAGLRLVLVITGKGKSGRDDGPIPTRTGALRHQLPHWLRLPPLGPLVLQAAEAHFRHGGSGAYYVYLRR